MIRWLAFVVLGLVAAGCGRGKDDPLPKVTEPTATEPPPKPQVVDPPKPPPPSKPVRRRDGDTIANWGKVTDPDADCTILEKDGMVSIAVPGTLHDINPTKDRRNSPRILRDIEGDFRAVVRVTGEFTPVPPSTSRSSVPFNGAGLLLFSDETNLALVSRNHFIINSTQHVCFAPLFEAFDNSKAILGNPPLVPASTFKGDSTALYLERKGNVLRGAYSHDAKSWEGWREATTTMPTRVKIGVVSISTSSQPFTVTFDGFQLLDTQ